MLAGLRCFSEWKWYVYVVNSRHICHYVTFAGSVSAQLHKAKTSFWTLVTAKERKTSALKKSENNCPSEANLNGGTSAKVVFCWYTGLWSTESSILQLLGMWLIRQRSFVVSRSLRWILISLSFSQLWPLLQKYNNHITGSTLLCQKLINILLIYLKLFLGPWTINVYCVAKPIYGVIY